MYKHKLSTKTKRTSIYIYIYSMDTEKLHTINVLLILYIHLAASISPARVEILPSVYVNLSSSCKLGFVPGLHAKTVDSHLVLDFTGMF